MTHGEKSHRNAQGEGSRRQLLFVCEVFHPDPSSTSQLFKAVFESPEFRDVDLTVITNHAPTGLAAAPSDCLPGNVSVIRTGLAIDGKKSISRRLLRYAAFVVGATVSIVLRPRDRILGLTNPPFTAVWLWLVTRITRQPYDLFLLDLYPEGLIGLGALHPRSWIACLWKRLNRQAYLRAEKLVVLGRDMALRISEDYGFSLDRITVFPHWSPFDQSSPVAFTDSRLISKLGLTDHFVVQYSGNMGLWHDIDTLVRAAALLKNVPKLRFLFVGGGVRRKPAEMLCRQLGADNVLWLDFQPLEQLADSLAACHVAIISQRDGLDGVAVPCKLYGILASGRAVLAAVPAMSEVARVVAEENCGTVVMPHDSAGIAAVIRQLVDDAATASAMGDRAFQAYRTKYTAAIAARKFDGLWRNR